MTNDNIVNCSVLDANDVRLDSLDKPGLNQGKVVTHITKQTEEILDSILPTLSTNTSSYVSKLFETSLGNLSSLDYITFSPNYLQEDTRVYDDRQTMKNADETVNSSTH